MQARYFFYAIIIAGQIQRVEADESGTHFSNPKFENGRNMMTNSTIKVSLKLTEEIEGYENLNVCLSFNKDEIDEGEILTNEEWKNITLSDNNSVLYINLVDSANPVLLEDFHQLNSTRKLYLKFDSPSSNAFKVDSTDTGWAISRTDEGVLKTTPVIAPILPKWMNNIVGRFLVYPLELAWLIVKLPVVVIMAVGLLTAKVLIPPKTEPAATTNIEVGDDGDG